MTGHSLGVAGRPGELVGRRKPGPATILGAMISADTRQRLDRLAEQIVTLRGYL
jgi:hypothetical protein